ncbi:MAG TPA: AP2 domain-containing protein [Paludibacter sp.]
MKEIKISKGFIALVDDEDYERVNQFNWNAINGKQTKYAVRCRKINGKWRNQLLHLFILGYENKIAKNIEVDHEDHNGLNCQKYNLRICTSSQNGMNALPRKNGTSKYKGVCFNKAANKFIAQVSYNKKVIFLGYFNDEIEAARVHDVAAKKYHGNFSFLNFID